MSMKAWVFVRASGAGYLGHVGWAFQWDGGRVICGGTENPPGTPHTSASEKGAWHTCINMQDVLREFTRNHLGCPPYDAVKIIDVANPDPGKAWNTMSWCEQQDYWATGIPRGRNCMDDSFDVLTAMGLPNLPWPTLHPSPNDWWANMPGTAMSLKGMSAQQESLHLETFAMPAAQAQEPAWRIPGTAAHKELMLRVEAEKPETV